MPTDYIIRDSNSFSELLAVVKLPNLFTASEKKEKNEIENKNQILKKSAFGPLPFSRVNLLGQKEDEYRRSTNVEKKNNVCSHTASRAD